jgi:type II secretory pathway pseudopilin PulG
MSRRRLTLAYTLLELVVASAMAAIITTAGISAFALFNRQRVRMERAVTGDEVAKVVLQYLVRETQRVGGATLRPWQAIAVEQDPCGSPGGVPCVTGDRITYAFADENALFTSCSIAGLTDSTITFESTSHAGLTGCCNQFRIDANGAPTVVAPVALSNRHIMLSSTGFGGTQEEQFRAVTYADNLSDLGNCTFNILTSGQVRPLSSTCKGPDGCVGGRPSNAVFFTNGLIGRRANAIPITVATAYIGCTTTSCADAPEDRGLFIFSDRDAGKSETTSIGPGDDNFAVSPNIIDLQVALGYDRNDDGEIEDSLDGVNDDFSGNRSPPAPGVAVDDIAAPPGRSTEDPRRLRMLQIGVISAIRVNDDGYTSEAQLPGGVPIVGRALHLRALTSRAAFRSLNLLE